MWAYHRRMDWVGRAREVLAGRLVVVTGASSGIGRAFVEAMAPAGARFVLVARRADLLEEVASTVRSAGSTALVQVVDLRDEAAAQGAAHAVLAELGVPDVLVANAGHSIARDLRGLVDRPDSIPRSVAANFTGPVAHALPILGAMAGRGAGHLIATTTANARVAVPGWSAYVASKAGWDAWLRSIAPELARDQVAATILAYGLVATPMATPTRGTAPRFALSTDQAAGWMARAVVTRPSRLAPWWLPAWEVLSAAAPATTARFTGRFSLRLRPR